MTKVNTVDLNKRYKSMALKTKKKSFLQRVKDKVTSLAFTLPLIVVNLPHMFLNLMVA